LEPLDPSLGVLAGVGLARLLTLASKRRGLGSKVVQGAVATAVVASGVGLEIDDNHSHLASWAAYGESLHRAHERLGRDLLALDLPESRLAISDAGAAPYL